MKSIKAKKRSKGDWSHDSVPRYVSVVRFLQDTWRRTQWVCTPSHMQSLSTWRSLESTVPSVHDSRWLYSTRRINYTIKAKRFEAQQVIKNEQDWTFSCLLIGQSFTHPSLAAVKTERLITFTGREADRKRWDGKKRRRIWNIPVSLKLLEVFHGVVLMNKGYDVFRFNKLVTELGIGNRGKKT